MYIIWTKEKKNILINYLKLGLPNNEIAIKMNVTYYSITNAIRKYKLSHYRVRISKLPWYMSFYDAKRRCEIKTHTSYKNYGGKGIKFLMTLADFEYIWKRDKAHLMKKPSIDRINNDGNYELSNCRFIELKENVSRTNNKTVLQFDLNKKFIKKWKNPIEIEKNLGFCRQAISQCCRNINKTSYNFIWEYQHENI